MVLQDNPTKESKGKKVVVNTRNSRAVPCNWKYPNCGNTTRDSSGYCSSHRTLAARISGDSLVYAKGETVIANRSHYVLDQKQRSTIYDRNAARLESYPIITVNKTPDDEYRAIIQNLTRNEVAARGITLTDKHKDGAVNVVAVTRHDKSDALYEASSIVAEVWANRLDEMEGQDTNSVDTYDSYVEAIAYARDWNKEIAELEKAKAIQPNGRTISFSQDRKSAQLVIKVYHQPKHNPEGFVEYDVVSFENELRSIKHDDGTESYIPHMTIDTPRSYRVKVDPETRQPKRYAGRDWSDIANGLIAKVSKLVAESNKFGVASEDGRIRLPTGWELRSKNAELKSR